MAFDICVDKDTGSLLSYQNWNVYEEIQRDAEAGRLLQSELTPAQALQRCEEYVRAMTGEFPDDLVLTEVRFPDTLVGPVDGGRERQPSSLASWQALWQVTFTRYAGNIPYDWQGVVAIFSEKYGVARYASQYRGEWSGQLVVSREEALETAEKWMMKYLDVTELSGRSFRYLSGEKVVVLQRPLHVKEGGPFLMPLDQDNPDSVRPVWVVVLPSAPLLVRDESGFLAWCDVAAYIDAATGAFVGLRDPLTAECWKPE